jgi:ornithine cyclodeaminase/alanine dehydrogenase-like protein (mu-crystallin family)
MKGADDEKGTTMKVTILTEPELRKCVAMDEDAFIVVADGFSRLAEGKATVPPIVRVDVPENSGEVDIKTAYVHGLDSFAVKIAAGFLNNRDLGLPTGSGMMILVSTKTGFVEAILLDNGYLTDVRTGIAGSIACHYLARKQIDTAGVIGS